MRNILIFLFLISLLVGCGSGANSNSDSGGLDSQNAGYNSESLRGKIGGQSWTFVTGVAKPNSFSTGNLSLTFWNENVQNPCGHFGFGSNLFAMTTVANQVGETAFSLGTNGQVGSTLTLYDGTTNLIATTGSIEIQNIDIPNGMITGRLRAFYNEANTINGTFTLTYCP